MLRGVMTQEYLKHGRGPLVALGDLAWDVLARPDTMLMAGGDTTGRMELSGGGSAANLAVWARRRDSRSTAGAADPT